jgi:oligopeptide/dipeptide ABC transporter ATP-binding protein
LNAAPLLSIRGLRTYFHLAQRGRFVRAVDDLDLDVQEGETLVVVGESGSGKSAVMLSVLGLLSATPGVVTGRVVYRRPGQAAALDLLEELPRFARFSAGPPASVAKNDRGWRRWSEARLGPLRGRDLAMIFQNPRSALHPYFTVGQQLVESIRRADASLSAAAARDAAADWLARVHIDAPRKRLLDYPHALSGGMCQRVMIAMALAARPALLIADEPTTGLDATVQARVMDLLEELKASTRTTTIVVTHDIGVARRLADRVAVLYAGRLIETGPARIVLDPDAEPKHPYTRGLLRSLPSAEDVRLRRRLTAIAGDVPDLSAAPRSGCRFAERCAAKADLDAERCETQEPGLDDVGSGHALRCWLAAKRTREDAS